MYATATWQVDQRVAVRQKLQPHQKVQQRRGAPGGVEVGGAGAGDAGLAAGDGGHESRVVGS